MARIMKEGRVFFERPVDELPKTLRHGMTAAGKSTAVPVYQARTARIVTLAPTVGLAGRMGNRQNEDDRIAIEAVEDGADIVATLPAGLELLYVTLGGPPEFKGAEFAVTLEADD